MDKPANRNQRKWDARYAQLKEYKAEHGDCFVPVGYAAISGLGSWVALQRKLKKKGKISDDRLERLEQVGFCVEAKKQVIKQHQKLWNERYDELKEYKNEHGDCNVPNSYSRNTALVRWVQWQRRSHNSGTLSNDRIIRLEQIGFSWGAVYMSYEHRWKHRYNQLVSFHRENGHTHIPSSYPELGQWSSRQRLKYKMGTISQERISLLEKIKFKWDGNKVSSEACKLGEEFNVSSDEEGSVSGGLGESENNNERMTGRKEINKRKITSRANDGKRKKSKLLVTSRTSKGTSQNVISKGAAKSTGADSDPPAASGVAVAPVEKLKNARSRRMSGIYEHVSRHCSYYRNKEVRDTSGVAVAPVEKLTNVRSKRTSGIYEHVSRHCSYYRNKEVHDTGSSRRHARGGPLYSRDEDPGDDVQNIIDDDDCKVNTRRDRQNDDVNGRCVSSNAESTKDDTALVRVAALEKSDVEDAEDRALQLELENFLRAEFALTLAD